jgi:hypothetical protein
VAGLVARGRACEAVLAGCAAVQPGARCPAARSDMARLMWAHHMWAHLMWAHHMWAHLMWAHHMWAHLMWAHHMKAHLMWAHLMWAHHMWAHLMWAHAPLPHVTAQEHTSPRPPTWSSCCPGLEAALLSSITHCAALPSIMNSAAPSSAACTCQRTST